jgi:RimJ/RimL family protein N-acetyltransferase
MQDMTGVDFVRLRTVNSFSWLGLRHQRRGIGREMRAAIVHLAFEGLGALRAESDAFDDNARSRGVSESLGYEENGTMLAPRPSGASLMRRYLLTREKWLASGRRDDIEIEGLAACLSLIGLGEVGG